MKIISIDINFNYRHPDGSVRRVLAAVSKHAGQTLGEQAMVDPHSEEDASGLEEDKNLLQQNIPLLEKIHAAIKEDFDVNSAL